MNPGSHNTLRHHMRAQRAVWPARSRWLWFGLRPACTLAALVGCALMAIDGPGVLAAVGAALAVLVVRPVRRPWVDCVTAVLVFPGSPLAAALVLSRMLVGVVAIRLAAPTRADGIRIVARGRRALFGIGKPDQVEAELRQALESGSGVLDKAIERWLSAWTTADVVEIAATTTGLLRGLLFWEWPYALPPSLPTRVMRLGISEAVMARAVQLVAVVVAAAATLLLGVARPAHIFGLHIPAVVAVFPSVAVAWWLSRSTRTRVITAPILVGVAGAFLYGWTLALLVGLGGFVGLAAHPLRSVAENRLLGRPVAVPRLPLLAGRPATRDRWAAARRGWSDNRIRAARRLWSDIADDHREPATVRAAAAAALAQLHLSVGALQRAVERAETAVALAPIAWRVRGQVSATAARVFLAAGDTDRAGVLLTDATRSRGQRRDPLVSMARAQLLALDSDTNSALVQLNRASGGLLRGGNLDQVIDSEVAVAALLVGRAPVATLMDRLDELLGFGFDTMDTTTFRVNTSRMERVAVALARGRLLLGRLQLDNGQFAVASTTLGFAVNGFTRPSDAADQGVARILLGAARNGGDRQAGLPELTTGVRQLESLRGQLAADHHRGGLASRHLRVYGLAFNALERLQDSDPDSALLAAELAESLRRGALARMLREGTPDLTQRVRELRNRIADLESSTIQRNAGDGLDQLRDELETALSSDFATAYLPEPVDLAAARTTLGAAHAITFHVQEFSADRLDGHVIWLPPGGVPVVTAVEVTDPSLLAALGVCGDDAREEVMRAVQSDAEVERWQALCVALLPAGLRAELLRTTRPLRLVVVPGDMLSTLPWPALRLADGRVLVESAVLQLIPALAMLDTDDDGPPCGTDVVAYLDGEVSTRAERRVLNEYGCRVVGSRESLLTSLSRNAFSGAYLAAHGTGLGLGQHIAFHDESTLSAASALTVRWPRWVLFASCLVGRVRMDIGRDPLGLPVSCLLGGARTVIGGVIEVNSSVSGKLCPNVVGRMLAGEHPAAALRAAQLDYLRSRSAVPGPAHWAGFVCLSRMSPAA